MTKEQKHKLKVLDPIQCEKDYKEFLANKEKQAKNQAIRDIMKDSGEFKLNKISPLDIDLFDTYEEALICDY